MPGPEVCQLTCLCERWHIFQESPGVNSGPEVVGAGVAPQISQLLVIIGSRCRGTCIIIAGTSQEPPHGSTRPSRPGRAWSGTSSESHHMAPPVRHGQAEPGQEPAVGVTAWLRPSVTARQGLAREQQYEPQHGSARPSHDKITLSVALFGFCSSEPAQTPLQT